MPPVAPTPPAHHAPGGEPTLGEQQTPNQKGFGAARPARLDAGGNPTGIVEDIRWQSWGGPTATGSGTATYLAPGQATAEGRPERATIVAGDLGRCPDGKQAYRSVHWYFPQHGETAPGQAGYPHLCA